MLSTARPLESVVPNVTQHIPGWLATPFVILEPNVPIETSGRKIGLNPSVQVRFQGRKHEDRESTKQLDPSRFD